MIAKRFKLDVALRAKLGWQISRVIRARIFGLACLLAAASWPIPIEGKHRAFASTNFFQFYTQICITVYELHQDHQHKVRDDLSRVVAPELERATKQINKWISVKSRPDCIQASDKYFEKVLSFELFIKRQTIEIQRKAMHLAVVGGSSSNGRGPFSDYELQPLVLLDSAPVDGDRIAQALTQYVLRVVLPVMKAAN